MAPRPSSRASWLRYFPLQTYNDEHAADFLKGAHAVLEREGRKRIADPDQQPADQFSRG